MTARYAVYYTPDSGSPLCQRAAAWLGRDAFTGDAVVRPEFPTLADLDLDALTAEPRGYGFHATLKAPFALAEGADEAGLLAFAQRFASARTPFYADIAPGRMGRFLAFRLAEAIAEMDFLHHDAVRQFDAFRAPLSEFDLARRRQAPLTAEQDARLVRWGYPYVFEEFRFHMTLTGPLLDARIAERLLEVLKAYFADLTGPHCFDGVAVFKQDDRAAPFVALDRYGFGASRQPRP